MIGVHQIYTFGAPMIGNAEAAKAFDREFGGKLFRYVNVLDPIPLLPTMSLVANQYGHCLTEVPLGAAGPSFLQAVPAMPPKDCSTPPSSTTSGKACRNGSAPTPWRCIAR